MQTTHQFDFLSMEQIGYNTHLHTTLTKKCYKVFDLQGGNQCYTSASAHSTYHKYGKSDKCKEDGRGGESASEVYKIVEGKYMNKPSYQ